MTAIILLSFICVVLLILLVVLFFSAIRMSRTVQSYEQFYSDTVEDIGSVANMLHDLMTRRQMLSDDPDVQNIQKVVVIAHDIVSGYLNASKKERKERTK